MENVWNPGGEEEEEDLETYERQVGKEMCERNEDSLYDIINAKKAK